MASSDAPTETKLWGGRFTGTLFIYNSIIVFGLA